MEGGWDRPPNRVRTLRERDGNNEPLAEGDEDNDEYAVRVDSGGKPLDKGGNKCGTLSAAPTQVCPEIQRPSMPSR